MQTKTTVGSTHEPCTVTLYSKWTEHALLRRVRGEFQEMPGMRLTLDQAMRLWALDRLECSRALEALVASKFLRQDATGTYTRTHFGY